MGKLNAGLAAYLKNKKSKAVATPKSNKVSKSVRKVATKSINNFVKQKAMGMNPTPSKKMMMAMGLNK